MGFNPLLTSSPSSSLRNNFDGCVGFAFTTPGYPLLIVTEVGRWKVSGNTQSHIVYIKREDGTVVAQGAVDFSGGAGITEAYNYIAITPVTLNANTKYYVLSVETNGGDQWHEDAVYLTSGVATVNNSSYSTGCTGAPTDATLGTSSYVAPNIKIGGHSYPHNAPRRLKVGTGMGRSDSAS